jgi:glucose-6-phosphate 1-epimerase
MRHGFARVSTWRHTGEGSFELTEKDLAPAHAQAWPHSFTLTLRVAVSGQDLNLFLHVSNTGADALVFASALHTYFKVGDVSQVRVTGIEDKAVTIDGKLDQIFRNVPPAIGLNELTLSMEGFRDVVVWNPGADDAAALSDMDDAEYREFVCVEPALLTPLRLEPGSSWHGQHTITVTP